MCGIAFTSFSVGASLAGVLRQRGPDGYAFARTLHGELHHSRLSIHGTQIQPVAWRDTLTAYNGEVYLPSCAREDDAAFIAERFARHGAQALHELNGAWSFLQVRGNRVYVVRDRYGLRPLFRYFDGERLVYASNIRIIETALRQVGVDLQPRPSTYPARGRVPLPAYYQHVVPLAPGVVETATLRRDDIVFDSRRWYRCEPREHGPLEELLEDAVRVRQHPRGAVAVSGGVDSYLLHAHTPRWIARYHLDVTGEADAARALGACILEPPALDEAEIADVLEQPYYAKPPNLYLAAAMKAHDPQVRVVLTGVGADELFGGYRHHSRPCMAETVREVYGLRVLGAHLAWRDVELAFVIPYHYGYRPDQAFLRYGIEARHPFMDHRVVETALTKAPDGKTELRRIATNLGWEPQDKRGFAFTR